MSHRALRLIRHRCEVCGGRRKLHWTACYGDVTGPVPTVQVQCPRCNPPYLPVLTAFRRSA